LPYALTIVRRTTSLPQGKKIFCPYLVLVRVPTNQPAIPLACRFVGTRTVTSGGRIAIRPYNRPTNNEFTAREENFLPLPRSGSCPHEPTGNSARMSVRGDTNRDFRRAYCHTPLQSSDEQGFYRKGRKFSALTPFLVLVRVPTNQPAIPL
jgi:hypothetical protein